MAGVVLLLIVAGVVRSGLDSERDATPPAVERSLPHRDPHPACTDDSAARPVFVEPAGAAFGDERLTLEDLRARFPALSRGESAPLPAPVRDALGELRGRVDPAHARRLRRLADADVYAVPFERHRASECVGGIALVPPLGGVGAGVCILVTTQRELRGAQCADGGTLGAFEAVTILKLEPVDGGANMRRLVLGFAPPGAVATELAIVDDLVEARVIGGLVAEVVTASVGDNPAGHRWITPRDRRVTQVRRQSLVVLIVGAGDRSLGDNAKRALAEVGIDRVRVREHPRGAGATQIFAAPAHVGNAVRVANRLGVESPFPIDIRHLGKFAAAAGRDAEIVVLLAG
jgi:hypothetical protein